MLYGNSITSVRQVEDFLCPFIHSEGKDKIEFPSPSERSKSMRQFPDKALIHCTDKEGPISQLRGRKKCPNSEAERFIYKTKATQIA